MSAEPRVAADDHAQLVELYARYTHAFDAGRADEVANLFTADGEFVRSGAPPVRGRASLAAMVGTAAARATGNRHLVSAVVVESGAAGTATGQAYVQLVCVPDGMRTVVMGRYDDDFALDDGHWRIRSRRFTPFPATPAAGS